MGKVWAGISLQKMQTHSSASTTTLAITWQKAVHFLVLLGPPLFSTL